MPKGDRGGMGNASKILGKNMPLPTEEEIKTRKAVYGGLPVYYHPEEHSDASNHTTEIHVSNKFFEHDEETRRHILNHEVAHNWSEEMISENTRNWSKFASIFIEEKPINPNSDAWRRGQRTYWQGLFGDVGATALSETTTEAIVYFFDHPEFLRSRSKKAYDFVRRFVMKKVRNA